MEGIQELKKEFNENNKECIQKTYATMNNGAEELIVNGYKVEQVSVYKRQG